MANKISSYDLEVMVSIICTTFNHVKFIRKALDSFLMQKTDFKFEVIVHDDASTDGTTEILRKYAEQYPDIIVPLYEEENQYSKHMNFANKMYAKAKGKYLAFCEGDDYWIDENKLQKQFDYMETHPDCSIYVHNGFILNDKNRDNPVFKDKVAPAYDKQIFYMRDFLEIFTKQNLGATSSIFMRKECCPRYSWLDRFSFGDLFIDLSALTHGYEYVTDETMSVYRVNNPSSYNGRIESLDIVDRLKERIRYCYEMIEALEYFNAETNYKWNTEIQLAKDTYKYERIKELFWGMCLYNESSVVLFLKSICKKFKRFLGKISM